MTSQSKKKKKKMTANDVAPDGGKKYFLVPPDTFELLIKNLQEAQQVKQQPSIQLALKLEKQILRVRRSFVRGESDQMKSRDVVKDLLRKHFKEICHLYKTSEFCIVQDESREKISDSDVVSVHDESVVVEEAATSSKFPKKARRSWIGLDQFIK